jgi:hypothetical protein
VYVREEETTLLENVRVTEHHFDVTEFGPRKSAETVFFGAWLFSDDEEFMLPQKRIHLQKDEREREREEKR